MDWQYIRDGLCTTFLISELTELYFVRISLLFPLFLWIGFSGRECNICKRFVLLREWNFCTSTSVIVGLLPLFLNKRIGSISVFVKGKMQKLNKASSKSIQNNLFLTGQRALHNTAFFLKLCTQFSQNNIIEPRGGKEIILRKINILY